MNGQNWVPMTDKRPSKGEYVLIFFPNDAGIQEIYVGQWDGDTFWVTEDCWFMSVTHWMPLPEPPQMISETAR